MACFVAFTDACPQESIQATTTPTWYTVAAIGVVVDYDPFDTRLVVPSANGPVGLLRIPNPQKFAAGISSEVKDAFRSWKDIRTQRRKSRAVQRLLRVCEDGKAVFLSHSTRSNLVEAVAERFLGRFCSSWIIRSQFVGADEFIVRPRGGAELVVSTRRLYSLVWLAHCLCVFLQKARESFDQIDGLFVHDNLPFNRKEDIEIVCALLNAQPMQRASFITERRSFEFAAADNLAAATNHFVRGVDQSIWSWATKNGRPGNFYMTVDTEDGFTRFV